MAKQYVGLRHPQHGAIVLVRETSADSHVNYRALTHRVKHSPDGFEWGYWGSGPAELARCMLIDLMGEHGTCQTCGGSGRDPHADGSGRERDCWACFGSGIAEWIERTYQDLKTDFIGVLPRDGSWIIEDAELLKWVGQRREPVASGD